MKRTGIGIGCLLAGILDIIGVITAAAVCVPTVTSWSTAYPSKLWFLIFAGRSTFNDGADGLGLGLLFMIGALLAAGGLVILAIELVRREK